MFLELIATFVAGFAAAGVVLLLNVLSGRRLPKWAMPVGAGLAMIGVTIWSEYQWYDRTVAALPEGIEIAEAHEARQLYRPWSYLAPITNRFLAVDVATMRSHEANPDQRIADIYAMGRWRAVSKVAVLVDCASQRRAPIVEGTTLAADGTVSGAQWMQVNGTDPILTTACAG